MNIYAIGVLISIILYIVIGSYAGSKVKDVDDYYVSGRNAPTILIAGTLFASMLSTNGFMGDTGWTYEGFITSMIMINALCGAGYIFGPILFGRYIRRMEVITMPQYFGDRFNSRRIQSLAGVTTIISMAAYLLAVLQGTTLLMEELTGMSKLVCLLIAWFCFTSFTFYSGSSGVILTDTVMFVIFIGATILAGPFVFKQAGGFLNIIPNLLKSADAPSDLLRYHGHLGGGAIMDNMSYMITIGLVWLITVAVSPWQASRNLMAKNEHVTFRSGVVACICTTLFLTFLYTMAISMNLINPAIEPTEKVMIWAAFNVMPKLMGVLVLTGIMAAGLSSASTFLSVSGFSATNDVFKFKFRDDKHQLWSSRWIMLGISIIALILAYFNPPAIRILSWFASTIIAASWGPVAFASIWSDKITEKGAFWGMLMGFLGQIGAESLTRFTAMSLTGFFHPFFIGVYLNLIAIYLGSKSSTVTEVEKTYLARMRVIPEAELFAKDYKIDKLYAKILMSAGVLIAVLLVVLWAVPVMNA